MDYQKKNDYELLYLANEQDEDSLKILLEKYDSILKSISSKYYKKYKYIGIMYDDLLQEAKISFVKALKSFNDDKSLFYSYVSLCVERHLISFCKSHNSLKNYPLNTSLCDTVLEYGENYHSEVIENILLENERFFECKNLLKFDQSIVFELKYNGFSYKEIAKLLDLNKSTVDGRISMIRKKIRNSLKLNI